MKLWLTSKANYEYAFYFNFALDGSIELEVKATGIVNAYTLKEGEPTDMAHEVYVAPRIAAHHHQHVSSLPWDCLRLAVHPLLGRL